MKKITFLCFAILSLSFCSSSFGQYLTEGFETSVPPAGWTLNTTNTNDPIFTWYQEANPHSGVSSAQVQYDPALDPQDETLVTPLLDLSTATTPRLKFWFNMSYFWGVDPNDNYDFTVSITDGVTDTVLWTEADLGVFDNFVWYEITLDLSAYAGTTDRQLMFNYSGSDGASLTLDDILVEETPMCDIPSNLSAINITENSAELGWTDSAGATAWDIELVDITGGGTSSGAVTYNDVTNTYVAMSLTDSNDYEFYVRADCGMDDVDVSAWVGPFAFTTLAPAPANDSFANAISIMCGDTVLGTTNAATIDEVGAPDVTTVEDDTPADNDSPNVWYSFMGTGDTVTLSTCNAGSNFDTEIMVFTGTSGALTLIDDGYDECGAPDYFAETIFTSVAATQYYISIEGWDLADVGDFELTVVCATCVAPSNGFSDTITSTTANLGWTENGTATSWNVEIGIAGFTPTGTATDPGVTNPFMATGLTAGTDYEFYVQSDCGGDQSTWSGPYAFTTTALPPANDDCAGAISVVQETGIPDAASATATPGTIAGATDSGLAAEECNAFTGTANDDVWYSFEALTTDVNITFEITGFDAVVQLYSGTCGALTVIDCADNTIVTDPIVEEIMATGLTVNDTYYVRIYQYGTTATAGKTFDLKVWTTELLSIDSFDNELAFTYYPNPVNNNLVLNAQKNIDNVSVFNMLGQEVLNATPNTINTDINMSELQSGTYFVKVSIDGNTETVKIIKN